MPENGPSRSPSLPLAGRRIVITRPEAEAASLARRLVALGATAIVVPAIQIEFVDPALLDGALARLGQYDWIIFTSRHGVEAVLRRTDSIKGPRIAAIGPVTAGELRRRGLEPDVVPDVFVAEEILEKLGPLAGRRILLPRADIARRAIVDRLLELGAEVDDIAVYYTRPGTAIRPDLAGVDAVTFTSSSTVKNFLATGPVPAGAKVVCIGPITAGTARESGLHVTEVAEDYTEDGLVTALLSIFGQ